VRGEVVATLEKTSANWQKQGGPFGRGALSYSGHQRLMKAAHDSTERVNFSSEEVMRF